MSNATPVITGLASPSDPDRLLNADQLADRWGCSRQHIYNLLKAGLPSLKLGRARRFRVSDVEGWLAQQQTDEVAS